MFPKLGVCQVNTGFNTKSWLIDLEDLGVPMGTPVLRNPHFFSIELDIIAASMIWKA